MALTLLTTSLKRLLGQQRVLVLFGRSVDLAQLLRELRLVQVDRMRDRLVHYSPVWPLINKPKSNDGPRTKSPLVLKGLSQERSYHLESEYEEGIPSSHRLPCCKYHRTPTFQCTDVWSKPSPKEVWPGQAAQMSSEWTIADTPRARLHCHG